MMRSIFSKAIRQSHKGEYGCVVSSFTSTRPILCLSSTQRFKSTSSKVTNGSLSNISTRAGGVGGTSNEDVRTHHTPTQRDLVHSIMMAENVYNTDVLEQEINSFFELIDLPMTYYLKFSPQQIANHVHAIIAAKEMSKSSGKEALEFHVEGRDHAMFVCSFGGEAMLRMEELVGDYIQATPKDYSCSVFSFHSKAPSGHSRDGLSSCPTIIYIATRDAFLSSPEEASRTDDIALLATKEFLSNRTSEVRAGYQEVLRTMNAQNIPIFHSFSTTQGHTHFTFAAGNGNSSLDAHNILPVITRVAGEYGLTFENKVVETFANGTTVFTYHAPRNMTASVMESFLFSVEQLMFTPASLMSLRSNITSQITEAVSSSALLYFHLAITFAEYFVSQHSDEYAALLVETANNPRANFHLCNLQKKLIMDSVTYTRVVETIGNYPGLALSIYEDFIVKTQKGSDGKDTYGKLNTALFEKVRKQVLNALDLEILQRFLIFNSVILQTNFHENQKPAVCLQLSDRVLQGTPFFSQNSPIHGVMQVMGIGHEGFLTMRSPISRCSLEILIPNSPDEEKRFESELYFINDVSSKLMHSKNKDVPVSGSACTVLLNYRCRHARRSLVLQFVSSVMSVLSRGHPETPTAVFWGPGANSHDLMDNITSIAKGYKDPFANACAAGKSRSLGGLTDVRAVSVSRLEIQKFVQDQLKFVPEEQTKIITGALSQQRTLDELLASKEKIIAIIDGCGVLYNSAGLDKAKLIALSLEHKSIMEYTLNKPTDGNTHHHTQFFVSRAQKNFTDPFTMRDIIASGDLFCERFLALPQVDADILVLCHKRMSPMYRYDKKNFIHQDSSGPKFKVIYEAVDLPMTEDTRSELERMGVIVLKDTITNKGTGMRSAYEILVALALTPQEFAEHMMLPSSKARDSEFYIEYANDVVELIRNVARRDIELVWREHSLGTRTAHGMTRAHVTNEISKKVTRLSAQLLEHNFLSKQKGLYTKVFRSVIPRSLVQKVGMNQLIERLPDAYKKNMLVKALTNEYVFTYGLSHDEFHFYEFVKKYQEIA